MSIKSNAIIILLLSVISICFVPLPEVNALTDKDGKSSTASSNSDSGTPASSQIESRLGTAQLYLNSGDSDKAALELAELLPLVSEKGSRIQYATTLNLLGAIYAAAPISAARDEESATNRSVRSMGGISTDRGKEMLGQALKLAREQGNIKLTASVLNNLGTMQMSRGRNDLASTSYQEALQLAKAAGEKELTGAILVNMSRLKAVQGETDMAFKALQEAAGFWSAMPENTDKGDALINIGQIYRKTATLQQETAKEARRSAIQCFLNAQKIAETTKNSRLLSFAIGYHAGILEESGETARSLELTRQALFQAQMIDSRELLYLWHWQMGRLLNSQGNIIGATGSYQQAINALQSIRRSTRAEYAGSALSFKEMIEPVYLGLVEILLKQSRSTDDKGKATSYLSSARDTIEKLRTAELQDYFKDSCILDSTRNSFSPSGSTAVIYLVTLPQRIEIIANLPSGLKNYSSPVEKSVLEVKARGLLRHLISRTDDYADASKTLYDLIVRPLDTDLKNEKIEHIIFVPDGVLRSVPMAVLNDGKQFIISKYTISSTQGMQLVNQSRASDKNQSEVLMAGISESVHDFPPLPGVEAELMGIGKIYNGVTLLNGGFKVEDLKREMSRKSYSYIHLATHGEFAGDMQNMYILAFDGLITFDLLDKFIKVTKYKSEPLELLTLSACKTAVGDERAALGLAGIAVKAGAKSTMASLWEIDDKATSELILEFYSQLKKNNGGKARALQQAQLKIMQDYGHPFFWSPFLLIGNWL